MPLLVLMLVPRWAKLSTTSKLCLSTVTWVPNRKYAVCLTPGDTLSCLRSLSDPYAFLFSLEIAVIKAAVVVANFINIIGGSFMLFLNIVLSPFSSAAHITFYNNIFNKSPDKYSLCLKPRLVSNGLLLISVYTVS
ncbi:unnamed protein product [Ceratitis capitata]|uniref:(Mediterranean fruit fly) hypothetical protein n=1 Tax=Ceratitis capitata TaxID=7213 RepID=A0A811VD28_CERCA|nr:unnamed protein product [Ceratitis capitata]